MIARDEIIDLTIDSIAFEGKSVARHDGFVIFVSGGVPGDLVKARITKRKKDYAEARVVEVVAPSPHRVAPRCNYFGVCGGCKWQNVDYEEQLRFKRQHVVDALTRTAGIAVEVAPTLGAPDAYEYRNKLEFTFSTKPFRIREGDTSEVALGFHAPGRYDKVIDIDRCHLGDEKVNAILNWFREAIDPESALKRETGLTIYDSGSHSGLLRFLTIRKSFSSGEYMVSAFILNEDPVMDRLAEGLRKALPFVSTFASVVNPTRAQVASGTVWKIHFGQGYITEKIGKYSFRISPLSFFQTNTMQAERLYGLIPDMIGRKVGTVFDLYSGTGSISIFISELADRITGYELVESSVDDAVENARINGIGNVSFVRTDLLALFKGADVVGNFRSLGQSNPDVIILDPPRSGLHPKIASGLHLLGAPKIVYVSCNPMTQARDLRELASHGYAVDRSQPVDMFPHTYHIENVVTLRKQQG